MMAGHQGSLVRYPLMILYGPLEVTGPGGGRPWEANDITFVLNF